VTWTISDLQQTCDSLLICAVLPFVDNSKKKRQDPSFSEIKIFWEKFGSYSYLHCFNIMLLWSASFQWLYSGVCHATRVKEMRQSLLECIYNSVESKSGNMIVDCSTLRLMNWLTCVQERAIFLGCRENIWRIAMELTICSCHIE